MTKHKVARKVAGNSTPPTNNRIKLGDWIREAHPEVWEQYCAIKDLEDAVEPPDLTLEHYKAHLKSLQQLEALKMSRWFKHGQ
jgi:hypothetical protein